ncbi:MAG: hypothetical protein ACYC8T_18240 [Myxococcaceae bacterium]
MLQLALLPALVLAASGAPSPMLKMSWGPLPSGWSAQYLGGSKGRAPPTGAVDLKAGPVLNLGGGDWGGKGGGAVIDLSFGQHPGLTSLAAYERLVFRAGGDLPEEELRRLYKVSETKLQGRRAFKSVGTLGEAQRQLGYFIELDPAKHLFVMASSDAKVRPGSGAAALARWAAEVDQVFATLRFGPVVEVVISSSKEQPLAFNFSLRPPILKEGERDPLEGVSEKKLLVHVFDEDFNVLKLDSRFQANSLWDGRESHLRPGAGGESPEALQQASLPIPLPLQGEEARLRLFPSFASLARWSSRYGGYGVNVPSARAPMSLTLRAELVGLDPEKKEVLLGAGQTTVTIDYVARVQATRFEAPQIQDPRQFELYGRGDPRPVEFGSLAMYARPPFSDPKAERRVLVNPSATGTIGQSGAVPGVPLLPGDVLRPGDVVRIDASKMVTYGIVEPKPPFRLQPGMVALRLTFLDGVTCELRVLEDIGQWAMTVAPSAAEAGFTSPDMQFGYFLGDFSQGQAADAALEWTVEKVLPQLTPGLNVINNAKDAYEVLSWLWTKQNVQHVRLNSKIFGVTGRAGWMRLSTVQGSPAVYSRKNPGGLKVPAGQTLNLRADGTSSLAPTDEATARRAVAVLGNPGRPAPPGPVVAGKLAAAGTGPVPPAPLPTVAAPPPAPAPAPAPAPPPAGPLTGRAQVQGGRAPGVIVFNTGATPWNRCSVVIPGQRRQVLRTLAPGFQRTMEYRYFSRDGTAPQLRGEVLVVCEEGSARLPAPGL